MSRSYWGARTRKSYQIIKYEVHNRVVTEWMKLGGKYIQRPSGTAVWYCDGVLSDPERFNGIEDTLASL